MNIAQLSGKTLGQHILGNLIAQDNLGALYRATLAHSQHEFSVRVMPISTDDQAARFNLFVELIAGVHHTNIPVIFDFAVSAGIGYIVFDYFKGGTLQQRLQSGHGSRPSAAEVNEVTQQIADALQYAHDRGILHVNLTPNSIFFNHQGEAFVVDFGLLALYDNEKGSFADDQKDLAQVVVTLLNGRANASNALKAVPATARPIISKAMADDPNQRYGSIKQFAFALSDALESERVATGFFTEPVAQPNQPHLPHLAGGQPDTPLPRPNKPPAYRLLAILGMLIGGVLLAAIAISTTLLTPNNPISSVTPRPNNAATLNARETQRAVAQATNLPQTIAALTALPNATAVPTLKPLLSSTATPFVFDPAQAVFQLPADTTVSIHDEFDGESLSSQNWYWWGDRPPVANGQLLFATGDYQSGLMMRGIGDGEGIVALFRYSSGNPELYLDNGIFDTPNYLRWSVLAHANLWEVYSLEGYYPSGALRLRDLALSPNQWYYLIFKVDAGGRFSAYIWRQDDPRQYALSISHAPDGNEWKNKVWQFVISGVDADLGFERVLKVRFPSGYVFPNQPLDFFSLSP